MIDYEVVSTKLGFLLVAGTEKGLSIVFLNEDESLLKQALLEEYPNAQLQRTNDERVRLWADMVKAYLEGYQTEESLLKLSLDIQGTAFQARVWEALRAIPSGETRTYSQIAQAIGAPQAVRAVASACASNRLAIVIPCHRVIRSDGSFSGYRWGAERKRRLLERERDGTK